MKKTLFFLIFLSHFLSAQNAELFSNNWYLSQMIINSQTTVSPAMQFSIGTSSFINNGSSYNFNSSYYNTAGSAITFSNVTDSFTRQGGGCTLAVYNGTNAAAAQVYDQKNCDFYFNPTSGTVFNYQILNNGASKTLIITNSTSGDQIFYNNFLLSTKERSLMKTFKIYPNPTSDFLMIEDIERNLKVKIYDLSGKLLYENLSSGKVMKADMTDFQKGQYILSIENYKPEFFIKK